MPANRRIVTALALALPTALLVAVGWFAREQWARIRELEGQLAAKGDVCDGLRQAIHEQKNENAKVKATNERLDYDTPMQLTDGTFICVLDRQGFSDQILVADDTYGLVIDAGGNNTLTYDAKGVGAEATWSTTIPTSLCVLVITMDSATDQMGMRVNNGTVEYETLADGRYIPLKYLFEYGDGTWGADFDGIWDIMAYDRVLDINEQQSICNYLYRKHGIST